MSNSLIGARRPSARVSRRQASSPGFFLTVPTAVRGGQEGGQALRSNSDSIGLSRPPPTFATRCGPPGNAQRFRRLSLTTHFCPCAYCPKGRMGTLRMMPTKSKSDSGEPMAFIPPRYCRTTAMSSRAPPRTTLCHMTLFVMPCGKSRDRFPPSLLPRLHNPEHQNGRTPPLDTAGGRWTGKSGAQTTAICVFHVHHPVNTRNPLGSRVSSLIF